MSAAATSLKVKHWLLKRIQKPEKTPIPEVVSGPGVASQLGPIAARLHVKKPLVVSDAMLSKLGLVKRCTDGLRAAGLDFAVYDKVVPNPPESQVEEGYQLYIEEGCDGLIAIGGGSPMDCCKIIGAKVMDAGKKSVAEYCGTFKVAGRTSSAAAIEKREKHYPPLIAIPTTAGTGSETTLAAVISFPDKKLKLTISDAAIIPRVAILDPEVTVSLPPHITAATGMDALTHAVESYLSYWQSPFTAYYSLRAVEKIGKWLEECHRNPSNLVAREMMLRASFEAGVAFTRAAVGYVHAIAHTLGAYFHTPHGVANAMVMPHVLDFYLEGDECIEPLCDLAVAIGIGVEHPSAYATPEGKRRLATSFVKKVRRMNSNMGVPTCVTNMTAGDVDAVVTRALTESHGEGKTFDLFDFGYPTPKYMDRTDMERVVRSILPGAASNHNNLSRL